MIARDRVIGAETAKIMVSWSPEGVVGWVWRINLVQQQEKWGKWRVVIGYGAGLVAVGVVILWKLISR